MVTGKKYDRQYILEETLWDLLPLALGELGGLLRSSKTPAGVKVQIIRMVMEYTMRKPETCAPLLRDKSKTPDIA